MSLRSKHFCGLEKMAAILNQGQALRKGDWGHPVAKLQAALIDLEFLIPMATKNGTACPDGIFNHETKSALVQFKLREGLDPSGALDAATLGRMDLLLWRETGNLGKTLDASDLRAIGSFAG